MNAIKLQGTSGISERRKRAFRFLAILLSCVIGLSLAELLLRWNQVRIAQSDSLDHGMMQYDEELGWRLAPGWGGQHRHHDYSVKYTINALGFRNDAPVLIGVKGNRLTMVVGDSFTFGMGVNDEETFVHRLNHPRSTGISYSNAAIPGFSTDQEMLLIEKRIMALRPARILLVVHLGNDLFDNLLPYPLQADLPKPYFVATGGGLKLHNNPVPLARKPRGAEFGSLAFAVWGNDKPHWTLRTKLEQRFEVFRILSQSVLPAEDHRSEFTRRFAPAFELFEALLSRTESDCRRNKVELTVSTLAGRSFVEDPGSVSEQYQDIFRDFVMACCARNKIEAIDLASQMRTRFQRNGGDWYFRNEGHLNANGHRIVAEILEAALAKFP